MEADQRNARIFGVLYLHHVHHLDTGTPLFTSRFSTTRPAYIAGGGEDNKIYFGVLLELLLIIANVGDHRRDRYPILRRQNKVLSIGLCHRSSGRVRVHRGRDHLRAWDREPA